MEATHSSSGCAINASGNHKEAADIEFYFSESDAVPLASAGSGTTGA
jgi:hypothetical protein